MFKDAEGDMWWKFSYECGISLIAGPADRERLSSRPLRLALSDSLLLCCLKTVGGQPGLWHQQAGWTQHRTGEILLLPLADITCGKDIPFQILKICKMRFCLITTMVPFSSYYTEFPAVLMNPVNCVFP